MAYGGFKDLLKATASDKFLHDKAVNIEKNSKYNGYQRGLAPMAFKIFIKKSSNTTHRGTGIAFDAVSQNQQLAKELKKLIIREI